MSRDVEDFCIGQSRFELPSTHFLTSVYKELLWSTVCCWQPVPCIIIELCAEIFNTDLFMIKSRTTFPFPCMVKGDTMQQDHLAPLCMHSSGLSKQQQTRCYLQCTASSLSPWHNRNHEMHSHVPSAEIFSIR